MANQFDKPGQGFGVSRHINRGRNNNSGQDSVTDPYQPERERQERKKRKRRKRRMKVSRARSYSSGGVGSLGGGSAG